MKPIALVLFGGVCSGKTTISTNFEKKENFEILSKDLNIFRSDMLAREGVITSWEELKIQSRQKTSSRNIVLDETIRVGDLEEIKSLGYELIGIQLNDDLLIRNKRLEQRNLRQKEILKELSVIVKKDLHNFTQEERRKIWKSREIYADISFSEVDKFDDLLKEIYLLGSLEMKEEEPNPLCFGELDFVCDLSFMDSVSNIDISYIIENKIPFDIYKKSKMKNIKYCVWDIGGVVYDFTLEHLHTWFLSKTLDLELYKERMGRFSYNEYMKGNIDYNELCKQICDFYCVDYSFDVQAEISYALWKGVGEDFPETIKLMALLNENGIVNCVLSNALSILLESGNYQSFVKPQNRFYSFDINFLKPNVEAYRYVKDKLDIKYSEMIFIDDKKKNVIAAMNLGLYSLIYDKSNITQDLSALV